MWEYQVKATQRSVVVGRGSIDMFDIIILAIAVAGLAVIGRIGGRFIAAEDSRSRVRDPLDDRTGWLPGPRDAALLAQSARELRASN